MSTAPLAWVIVVPVKPSAIGKSRLAGAGVDRERLARAVALDTISAAASTTGVVEVVVVTDDTAVTAEAAALARVRVVREGAARGLDAAIATGADFAGADVARAALLGDLPSLRPADLAVALQAAASVDRGVVADAEGTGSTLVTALPGVAWVSRFGEDSFARHRALGALALEIPDASTLRRDVDTAAQLEAAQALGLGPRTAALLGGPPPSE